MIVCGSCRSEIPPGARFCVRCGAPAPVLPTPVPAPAPTLTWPVPGQPWAASTYPAPPAPEPIGRTGRTVGIIIAAVVVLVLVGVAGFVGWRFRHRSSPQASPTPTAVVGNVFPEIYVGSWRGDYVQSNGQTWQMALTVPPGSDTAQVHYPEIPCDGLVTMVGRDGGATLAREQITVGRCTPGGDLRMGMLESEKLEIEYTPDSGTYTAVAQLTRVAA